MGGDNRLAALREAVEKGVEELNEAGRRWDVEVLAGGEVRYGCLGCGEEVVVGGRSFAEDSWFCARCRECLSDEQKVRLVRAAREEHGAAMGRRKEIRQEVRRRCRLPEAVLAEWEERALAQERAAEAQRERELEEKATARKRAAREGLVYKGSAMYERAVREGEAELAKEREKGRRRYQREGAKGEEGQKREKGKRKHRAKERSDIESDEYGVQGWSAHTIMNCSKADLLSGVKRGKISAVRARIELRRRAQMRFYSFCDKT